jgi:hypothetical protein
VTASRSGPPQSRGHYSLDRKEWFDSGWRAWFPTTGEYDELEIELQYLGAPWWAGMLAYAGTPPVLCRHRFVGRATSPDRRWGRYRVAGPVFDRRDSRVPSRGPNAWTPGMTEALDALEGRLVAEGWELSGQGSRPWSIRYRRPCLDWSQPSRTPTRHDSSKE